MRSIAIESLAPPVTYLVDGHRASIVLVAALCVDKLCCEGVLPACATGRARRRRWWQVVAIDIEHRALALGAFASHCRWCCASSEGGRR